jgi:fatty acid desaturase
MHYANTDNSPRKANLESPELVVREINHLVRDLHGHKPWIYWIDLLLFTFLGQAAFVVYYRSTTIGWKLAGFFVTAFAVYRCSMFIHELQHLRAGTFRGFKVAWNLLCGIPYLIPQFTYGDHHGHHTNREYGTADDAEYLMIVQKPIQSALYMLTRIFWLPPYWVLRFLVMTPLAWLNTAFREWVWKYPSRGPAVNLVRNFYLPSRRDEPYWRLQEFGCFVFLVGLTTLLFTGMLDWRYLWHVYFLSVFMIAISHTRTITSHRFRNDGSEMTYYEQLLDSTTIPGHPIFTELWCPIGLRYHALHHISPSLPYHNLGIAHRRLMAELPPGTLYHATLRRGLWHAVSDVGRTIVRTARRKRRIESRRRRQFAIQATARD